MTELKDEHIPETVELTDKEDVNACLKIGWTLIDTYIIDYGTAGIKDEGITYCLGWPRELGETVYPEGVAERLKIMKELDEKMKEVRNLMNNFRNMNKDMPWA